MGTIHYNNNMFSTSFQGGILFDIFHCQGSNPLAKWKILGKSIKKI